MNNYIVQKFVEQLLINCIMFKNVVYKVKVNSCSIGLHEYIVHNLKAEIEDGVVWFNEHCVPDLVIDLINNIDITEDEIMISFIGSDDYIDISLMK